MIRKIIKIDEEKCNGCGACAAACHEGAIEMVNGKARLAREDYCDGLGDCLPACPTDAISFEEREAPAYDEAAVLASKAAKEAKAEVSKVDLGHASPAGDLSVKAAHGGGHGCSGGGCPGSQARAIRRGIEGDPSHKSPAVSRLSQWPVQIKLVPVNAPYFDGARLLVAADCTAFAYGNFHEEFIKDHVTLIGCPKLDSVDYTEKLRAIIAANDVKSVTVVRMEVPCCGGIENAVKRALMASGKFIPWQVVTVTTDGRILK